MGNCFSRLVQHRLVAPAVLYVVISPCGANQAQVAVRQKNPKTGQRSGEFYSEPVSIERCEVKLNWPIQGKSCKMNGKPIDLNFCLLEPKRFRTAPTVAAAVTLPLVVPLHQGNCPSPTGDGVKVLTISECLYDQIISSTTLRSAPPGPLAGGRRPVGISGQAGWQADRQASATRALERLQSRLAEQSQLEEKKRQELRRANTNLAGLSRSNTFTVKEPTYPLDRLPSAPAPPPGRQKLAPLPASYQPSLPGGGPAPRPPDGPKLRVSRPVQGSGERARWTAPVQPPYMDLESEGDDRTA